MWYTSNNDWKQSFENKRKEQNMLTIKNTEKGTWVVMKSDDGENWTVVYESEDFIKATNEYEFLVAETSFP